MRVTKYQHACVVLEFNNQKIVIDPGNCTPTFGGLDDISAVVVTHVHPDHFYPEHLEKIITHNPTVSIFTTEEVKQNFPKSNVVVVRDGNEQSVGSLLLHFTGCTHATVHQDWPATVSNIGVRVGNEFYYGGDSFMLPDTPVHVLAVPVAYAWARMDEVIDFVATAKPQVCFPTHNNQLSDDGNAVANSWLSRVCKKYDIDFNPLKIGEYLDAQLELVI